MKKNNSLEYQVLEALRYPIEELKKAVDEEAARKAIQEKFPTLYYGWYEIDYIRTASSNPFFKLIYAEYDDYHFVGCKQWQDIIQAVIQARMFGNALIEKVTQLATTNKRCKILLEEITELSGDNPDINQIIQKAVSEKLEKRLQSKQGFSAQRLCRLKSVFSKTVHVKIAEEEKNMIISPFPLLVASANSRCMFMGTKEAHLFSARWGMDVDLVFVKEENFPIMIQWLEKQGLKEKVRVQTMESISPAFSLPLYHTSADTMGESVNISAYQYECINKQIKAILPLYQKSFPDGSERKIHGVVHGTRAAFFSAIITEMYLSQGYSLKAHPQYLPITAFFHDTGRERDDGQDLWDGQSGKICADFMRETHKLEQQEVDILFNSIAEKDANLAHSVEQKIVHDADCWEILRGIDNPESSFIREELWMFKDEFPKQLLDIFFHEALSLIKLTEQPIIKDFIQHSSDPFRCLLQIMDFSKKFPLFQANVYEALLALCAPSDYCLTPTIEKAIFDFVHKKIDI